MVVSYICRLNCKAPECFFTQSYISLKLCVVNAILIWGFTNNAESGEPHEGLNMRLQGHSRRSIWSGFGQATIFAKFYFT